MAINISLSTPIIALLSLLFISAIIIIFLAVYRRHKTYTRFGDIAVPTPTSTPQNLISYINDLQTATTTTTAPSSSSPSCTNTPPNPYTDSLIYQNAFNRNLAITRIIDDYQIYLTSLVTGSRDSIAEFERYLHLRHPIIFSDPVIANRPSISEIIAYYKAKTHLNPNPHIPNPFINKYIILSGQIIPLNHLNVEITAVQINYMIDDITYVVFPYGVISASATEMSVRLSDHIIPSRMTLGPTESDVIIGVLTANGFVSNAIINIMQITTTEIAFKNTNYGTIFQMKIDLNPASSIQVKIY
jgi:hypothetical protein